MNRNYQKFILLSSERNGTNLLTGLLNSHPMIVSHHECFRPLFFQTGDHTGVIDRFILRPYRDAFPVPFIRSYIYKRYPKQIHAVGFELFYKQGKSLDIWNFLRNTNNIKIIHLKRINLLRTYLSLTIASKTNIWITTDQNQIHPISVYLSANKCRAFFIMIDMYRAYFNAFFQHNNVLQITYEDLVNNQEKEIHRILSFLQVPYQELHCPLIKINTRSLKQSIKNYAALRCSFASTKWSIFFEE